MRVSELIGAKLDVAVAKALGWKLTPFRQLYVWTDPTRMGWRKNIGLWNPSADWSQAGPIIEREEIVWAWVNTLDEELNRRKLAVPCGNWELKHKSPLVAAMRMFVATKFGDEVPDEMLK